MHLIEAQVINFIFNKLFLDSFPVLMTHLSNYFTSYLFVAIRHASLSRFITY